MKKQHRRPGPTSPTDHALLDAFSARDLEAWDTRSTTAQDYFDRVYFDLERHRAAHHDELCAALRTVPAIDVPLGNWVRVTDWRWNLMPLSPAGSIQQIGGRFNIGVELDRARGHAFPALYIARDVETAYREYFGAPLNSPSGELSLLEFALRTESSFTTFALQVRLEQVFDLSEPSGLTEFVKILARFDVSRDTKSFARKARLQPRSIVKTPKKLWTLALMPPAIWRSECQMFGIPVPGQMFGRFARDAGFEAILYPSQQGGRECLAVFPENFRASNSQIQVVGHVPPGASCTVLDRHHLCLDDLG